MKRAAGFTLIELMVTVAIMAVLALAGMPFAKSWMESNRQMQARNLLWEGIAQSRAVALRNPGGTTAVPAQPWSGGKERRRRPGGTGRSSAGGGGAPGPARAEVRMGP